MSNFKDNSAQAIRALQDAAYKGMTKAAKVKNTGYVPPYIPGPLGPATLEREG